MLHVEDPPSLQQQQIVADMYLANPFCAPEYLQAMSLLGYTVKILTIKPNSTIEWACPIFIKRGRMNSWLEIHSLPNDPLEFSEGSFWVDFIAFCRDNKITEVSINTYDSPEFEIPILPGEQIRAKRWEYYIDLPGIDLRKLLGSSRRRRVNKGRKIGLEIIEATDLDDACENHILALAGSKDRRSQRGENIQYSEMDTYKSLVNSGAGEIYHAVLDGDLCSSTLLLKNEKTAYLHSQGSTAKGFKYDSSQYLLHCVMLELQKEGLEIMNLGGVDDLESGLARFKSEFGGKLKTLEKIQLNIGNGFSKIVNNSFGKIRGVFGRN